MSVLDKVRLCVSPLSRQLVYARFGKDPQLALETNDFFQVVTAYAFEKPPEVGAKARVQFGGGDEQFVMIVERIPAAQADVEKVDA